MNKTESQDLDTTPILIPLEANLPTEAPTSVNGGQKPQSNPDSDDQEPLLELEHEEEDESRPFTDLGPFTISSSSDQGEDESPRTTRDVLQVAAPGSTSHQEGRKLPDKYVTIPILRNITLGIFSCMTLLVLLNTLVSIMVCQGASLATRVLGEANLFSVLKEALDDKPRCGPRIFKGHRNITELVSALLNFALNRGVGLHRP